MSETHPVDYLADSFNNLSAAEAERLALLIEEAAEVQQIACKILRHGYSSFNPDLLVNQGSGGPKLVNRAMLEKELGHLKHAIHRMYSADDVDMREVDRCCNRKADTIGQWLHHQPDAQT